MTNARALFVRCAVVMLATGVAALSGCTESKMYYHFAAVDVDQSPPELKFFRITVHGKSCNEKSRLLTGFYDADALHALFGQVSEPGPDDEARSADGDRVGGVVVQIDASGKCRVVQQNERFTVLWGTNADAMADQVGAFAESQTTGEGVGRLMAAAAGAQTFADASTATQTAAEKKQARESLASKLKELAVSTGKINIPDGATIDAVRPALRKELRKAAQAALLKAGAGTVLDDDPEIAFKQAQAAYDALASGGE